jgi:hypothetical protein
MAAERVESVWPRCFGLKVQDRSGATGATGGQASVRQSAKREGIAIPVPDCQGFRNSSGSLAIFAAIRRASSLLSNLAADRRPGSSSK